MSGHHPHDGFARVGLAVNDNVHLQGLGINPVGNLQNKGVPSVEVIVGTVREKLGTCSYPNSNHRAVGIGGILVVGAPGKRVSSKVGSSNNGRRPSNGIAVLIHLHSKLTLDAENGSQVVPTGILQCVYAPGKFTSVVSTRSSHKKGGAQGDVIAEVIIRQSVIGGNLGLHGPCAVCILLVKIGVARIGFVAIVELARGPNQHPIAQGIHAPSEVILPYPVGRNQLGLFLPDTSTVPLKDIDRPDVAQVPRVVKFRSDVGIVAIQLYGSTKLVDRSTVGRGQLRRLNPDVAFHPGKQIRRTCGNSTIIPCSMGSN